MLGPSDLVTDELLRLICEETGDFLLSFDSGSEKDAGLVTGEPKVINSAISIIGQQVSYILFVQADDRTVNSIGAHVFDDQDEVGSPEQIKREALSEFTNIVAGRVIDFLDGEYQLSLPMIMPRDTRFRVPSHLIIAEAEVKRGMYVAFTAKSTTR